MNGEPLSEGFSARVARLLIRYRLAVVGFWVVAAFATTFLLPTLEQGGTGSLGDLVANDADAIDAEARSVDLFRFPVLSRTVVVERSESGLDRGQAAEIYRRSARLALGELPGLTSIPFALTVTDAILSDLAAGDATAALTYLFFPQDIGPVGRTGLAERLVDRQVSTAGPAQQVGITGAVPARGEQIRSIRDSLPLVEMATLLLVTLTVGIHFRSLLAPVANVITIALAYLIATRLVGSVGSLVGLSVPEEVEPVMVALLFGIVTDYVIFFLSRFRGHRRDGVPHIRAAELTTASLWPVVLTAGLSVAAASAGLIVAQLGFFRAFGPGLAVTVLIAVAVVLTFVPAVLALFGKWLFRPGRPSRVGGELGDRGAIASALGPLRRVRDDLIALPIRRPLTVAIATALPLIALTLILPRLELANTLISGLPRDSPPKQSFRLAAEDFPAGAISPTMILVERPGIAAEITALRRLQTALERRRNVSSVIGPANLGEPAQLGATVSPTLDAVRYLLVFDLDPFGSRAISTVSRLRDDLDGLLAAAGLPGAVATLAGDTAITEETVRKTESDLARVVPVAAIVVFIVLALYLGALVAPLYLVAASLLGLGASLGLTVLVFQDLLGFGELSFYVPFTGTVLLIALGSDYNVYLAGEVWAEARRRPLREAVQIAAARATSAITIAGLVLALSFALLAIVPLRPFRELAFLLGAGLLIDAFIVRTFLAPALITLVGERGGWPGKRLQPTTRARGLRGLRAGQE